MKLLLATFLMFCMCATVLAQEDEVAWFDLGNCEICQTMTGIEGMMENMKWEIHIIDNGSLNVTVLPDDFKAKYAEAMKNVEATVAKFENGHSPELCGYCKSFMALEKMGAKRTQLDTAGGHIQLITSDDPEIVAKIHEHAKRTHAETEKLMEMAGEHSHDGDHEHGDHEHGDKDDHKHDKDK